MAAGVATIGAGKMAMDAENNFAKVNSILGLSAKSWQKYEDTLKSGAKNVGKSYEEYADAAYQAISASVKQSEVNGFLADSATLAKGGLTSLTSAVDLLTTIENAYNLSASETGRISDILVQTQNKGKTTVDQLAASMGKVIPTAKNAGVSIEQLGAAYAIMTRNGTSTKITTTQVNSMISELSKTGIKADQALKSAAGGGIAELMSKGKNLGDVLNILNDHAKKSGLSLKDMFANGNAGKAALSLMSEGTKGFSKELSNMENAAGLAKNAANEMSNTTQAKLTKAINQAKNAAADFGAEVLPIITPLLEKGTKLASKFSEMPTGIKRIATSTGLLLTVASPALTSIGHITTGAGKLIEKVGMMSKATEGAATKTKLLAKASGALTRILPLIPWGVVVAGVGSVGVAIVAAYRNIHKYTLAQAKSQRQRMQSIETAGEEADAVQVYAKRLDYLMGKEKRTASDKALIREYVEKLNGSVEGLNLTYDTETDKLNKSTDAIYKKIDAMKQEAKMNAYKDAMAKTAKDIAENELKLAKAKEKSAELQTKYDEAVASGNPVLIEQAYKAWKKNKTEVKDLTEAIKNGEKEADGYGDILANIKNKHAFDELVKSAKLSGKDIPQALKEGIESGKLKVPSSVKNLKKSIKFYDAAQKAGIAGKDIPKELANGVANGSVSVKEAMKRMKNWIKVQDMAKKAGVESKKIPKKIRSGILSGKMDVKKAMKNINSSVQKSIAKNDVKTPAKKKSQEARKGAESVSFSRTGKKKAGQFTRGYGSGGFYHAGSKGAGAAKRGAGSVDFTPTGAEAMQGYKNGASGQQAIAALLNAGVAMANAVMQGIRKAQASKSPSKVAMKLGSFAKEGYILGSKEKHGELQQAGRNVANAMMHGMQDVDLQFGALHAPNLPNIGKIMEASPNLRIRTETGSIGNDVANVVAEIMRMKGSTPKEKLPDIHLTTYLFPNGPKMDEVVVKSYDRGKRRRG